MMEILSEPSLLFQRMFLSDSYSNLMNILSEASLLFQSVFLVQIFFQIDDKPLRSIPPLTNHVSHLVLHKKRWKSFLKHLSSSMHVSFSNLMNILSAAFLLFQSMFLMQNWWTSFQESFFVNVPFQDLYCFTEFLSGGIFVLLPFYLWCVSCFEQVLMCLRVVCLLSPVCFCYFLHFFVNDICCYEDKRNK